MSFYLFIAISRSKMCVTALTILCSKPKCQRFSNDSKETNQVQAGQEEEKINIELKN